MSSDLALCSICCSIYGCC